MKIVSIDAIPVAIPSPRPYLGPAPDTAVAGYFTRPPWRSLYSRRFESLLIHVVCDDGTEGWGEALAPVGPQVPAAVVDHLLAPQLIGQDPRQVRLLRTELAGLMRERGHLSGHQADALAAVDLALWDLKGKALGASVAELLGGVSRTSVPTYVSGLPGETPQDRAGLAADWAAGGATALKLAAGHGIAADLAAFDAVQAAAPDARVAVDAHWAYDLADARRLGRALDERGAWFLEAPLEPEDVRGHTELARAIDLPVAVGETLRERFAFQHWLGARAVGLAQPDVGRTGLTEAMAILDVCESQFTPVTLHHSTGLAIALAGALHLAAANTWCRAVELQPDTLKPGNTITTTPIMLRDNQFVLPGGTGLGVEVDLDVVRAHDLRRSHDNS